MLSHAFSHSVGVHVASVAADGAGNGTLLLLNATLARATDLFVCEYPVVNIASGRANEVNLTWSNLTRPVFRINVLGKFVPFPYCSNADVLHCLTKLRNRLLASPEGQEGSKLVVIGGHSCGFLTLRDALKNSNVDVIHGIQQTFFTSEVRRKSPIVCNSSLSLNPSQVDKMNTFAAEKVTSLEFLAALAAAKNVDYTRPTALSSMLLLLTLFRKFVEAFQAVDTRPFCLLFL